MSPSLSSSTSHANVQATMLVQKGRDASTRMAARTEGRTTSSARVDLLPFGGVKASGEGLEGPHYAVREMTEQRLVTLGGDS
jgi:acyl-CoA reductase-like NAD-dependent aldehyde dehydrogenase